MGLKGGGAFNRILGPIHPMWLNNVAYVAIDFDQAATAFPNRRTGLKALYNSFINLDYRHLVGFARDISAITEEEEAALPRSRRISQFPGDLLKATGTEFTGVYEDGWLTSDSEFALGGAESGDIVRLKGFVPELAGSGTDGDLIATINGGPPLRTESPPGEFDWAFPIAGAGKTTHIAFHYTNGGSLPGTDGRPVAAKMQLLEIVRDDSRRWDLGSAGSLRPPTEGIDQDGWAQAVATLALPVRAGRAGIQVEIEFPGWPGVPPEGELRVSVDGAPLKVQILKPGRNLIALPASAGLSVREVRLEAAHTFRLPAPDKRERAFRILSASETSQQ